MTRTIGLFLAFIIILGAGTSHAGHRIIRRTDVGAAAQTQPQNPGAQGSNWWWNGRLNFGPHTQGHYGWHSGYHPGPNTGWHRGIHRGYHNTNHWGFYRTYGRPYNATWGW